MNWMRWRRWNSDLRWSRWHIARDENWTICGTRIDSPTQERRINMQEPKTGMCQRCYRLRPAHRGWEDD